MPPQSDPFRLSNPGSDELLALALEASQIGFYDWNIQTDQVSFSAQMRKDWGIERDQIGTLAAALGLIHPDDQSRVRLEIERCIRDRVAYQTEYRVIRSSDEKIAWMEVRGKIRYSAEGVAQRFLGTCIDITARKYAAESERQIRINLQVALQAGQMAAWHVDLKTYKATLSPEVARIFGVETIENQEVSDIINRVIHPDDQVLANQILGTAVAERKPYRHEYRVIWPSGEVRWVLSQGAVVPATGQDSEAYAGVILDITARKRAEETLQKSEHELKELCEAMPQMVFIAEANGDILFYNSQHYDYFGVSESDHVRWGWRDGALPTIHPDDLARTVATWTNALKTGQIYQIEYRLRRADGTYRWHLGRAIPYRDPQGKIIRWYGTNTDIQALKHAESELGDAVRARDEFLSIASHELKTPLTALGLKAQIHARAIQRDDPSAFVRPRVEALVFQTEKQVRRLNRLVDDMLDVSRIQSGHLNILRESFDLTSLAEEVIERMTSQYAEASLPPPILISSEALMGNWDRLRIEQVLTNLLSNALRYGQGKPVEVEASPGENHHVRLIVRDRGMGIAADALGKIFSRFERAIRANEISGLGLGLFIAEQIVVAHGGSIRVESTLGEGSTFVVDLPRD